MFNALAYPQGATPLYAQLTQHLTIAERLVRQCERALRNYEECTDVQLLNNGLSSFREKKQITRGYLMRHLKTIVPPATGNKAVREKELDKCLDYLVQNGFLEINGIGSAGQFKYVLTGLHTTSAGLKLKEYK